MTPGPRRLSAFLSATPLSSPSLCPRRPRASARAGRFTRPAGGVSRLDHVRCAGDRRSSGRRLPRAGRPDHDRLPRASAAAGRREPYSRLLRGIVTAAPRVSAAGGGRALNGWLRSRSSAESGPGVDRSPGHRYPSHTTTLCLTYLELGVIHAVCYWCVSSAVCAALHVIVNSTRYVRGDPGTDQRRERGGRGDRRAASRCASDGGRCQRRGSRSAPQSAQPAA